MKIKEEGSYLVAPKSGKENRLTFLNIRFAPSITAKSLVNLIWLFSSAP